MPCAAAAALGTVLLLPAAGAAAATSGGTYPPSGGRWRPSRRRRWRWRPNSSAPFVRYTVAQARACVAGRHVVFAGDSKEWPSWDEYLRGSTAAFGGRMCCDCKRGIVPFANKRRVIPTRKARAPKGGRWCRNEPHKYEQCMMRRAREEHWRSQRENRFYRAPGGAWRASFFFLHGDFEAHGGRAGWAEGCPAMLGAHHAPPGRDVYRERWRGTTAAILRALREEGDAADAVVFNTGLWMPTWISDDDKVRRAVDAAEAMLRPPAPGRRPLRGRLVWQTITQRCQQWRDWAHERVVLDEVRRRGWVVFDAGNSTEALARDIGMPMALLPRGHKSATEIRQFGGPLRATCSQAFVDMNGHFQPFVYAELGLMLLNAIGC
eukprot:gene39591-17948_t